ncbi:unnamed protein product, partial [Staurois parvus]
HCTCVKKEEPITGKAVSTWFTLITRALIISALSISASPSVQHNTAHQCHLSVPINATSSVHPDQCLLIRAHQCSLICAHQCNLISAHHSAHLCSAVHLPVPSSATQQC